MIRSLQKRFIVTAMIAISALLLVLLGAINITNTVMVSRLIEQRAHLLASQEEPQEQPGGFWKPSDNATKPDDVAVSSTYFLAGYNNSGEFMYLDTSHIPFLTQEEAQALAQEILDSGKESGRTGQFYFTVQDDRWGQGRVVVALDTTQEMHARLRLLMLTAGIGLACWLGMLVFVILLSKRAIRPIAENMEKQKQFITNAGHELKTPLAIIQANADALELYQGENKWTRNIKQQTVRLNGLMKNLLLLARMDEDNRKLTFSRFSLSDLARQMGENFTEPMQARNLTLVLHIQPGIDLEADKEQITQLLSILLDNAGKYAKEGTSVELALRRENRCILLQVVNQCETLPEVPPERLFDRFYRADEARTQKTGGYGIGLSAAQGIAGANRGKLKASYTMPDTILFQVKFYRDTK